MSFTKLTEVTEEEWAKVNEVNREITEEFLKQYHLSPQTLKQYRSALRIFFRWVCEECGNKPIYKLKPRDALRYQNYLIELGLSSSAIKFKRAAVSSLCGYIEIYYSDEDEYKNFRNIFNKKIPSPAKVLVREKKPLSQEEYEHLIKTLEEQGQWQMVAYVKFTYSTGCRRAEARQLLKDIVNYDKVPGKNYYMTHNIRCKGRGREGKVRKLVFDDEAMEAIKKWLEVRGEDDCPYVFITRDRSGKPRQVSETTFNYWCKNVFSKIVGRRVHPHQFREQRATDLVVGKKKDITVAQKLLGHEDPSTTNLYVVRQGEEELDEIF